MPTHERDVAAAGPVVSTVAVATCASRPAEVVMTEEMELMEAMIAVGEIEVATCSVEEGILSRILAS